MRGKSAEMQPLLEVVPIIRTDVAEFQKGPLFGWFSHRIGVMDGCGGAAEGATEEQETLAAEAGGRRGINGGRPTNERTSVAIQRLLLTKIANARVL